MSRLLTFLAALATALTLTAVPGASAATPSVGPALAQSGSSLLKPATTWTTYKDVRYSTASSGKATLADVYAPNNGQAQNPTVVWVHGGGWSSGDKADNASLFSPLIKTGFVVVSINYRLSAEAKWPAQLVDTKTAVRFLRAKATTYRIWPDKIGIWGASAGGHLATMAGLTNSDPVWDVGQWLDQPSSVAAVQDDYGPTDLPRWTSNFAYPDPNSWVTPLLGCRASTCPDKARNASPITYAHTGGKPPVAIWHGTSDFTVPPSQSTVLRDALVAAGNTATYTSVPGMSHGQVSYYTAARVTAVGTWFDGYLRS